MAQHLGVDANWTSALLPMMADANRFRLRRMVEDPVYRSTVTQQSLKTFDAIEKSLSEKTVYQAMETTLASEKLPRV
jgi:hypothetical protein